MNYYILMVYIDFMAELKFPIEYLGLYGSLNDIGASATLAPYFLVTLGPILLR